MQIVRTAILKAASKKLTVVAATGNFFDDLASLPGSKPGVQCKVLPVSLPKVIGVSAVGYTRKLSFYSDYGLRQGRPRPRLSSDSLIPDALVTDTTASGQILSTIPPGSLFYQGAADYDGQVQDCSSGTCATYAYIQGTSESAPHVAGVAALLVSRFGKMTPDALLVKLSLGATPLACPPGPYDPGQTGQPATCKGPLSWQQLLRRRGSRRWPPSGSGVPVRRTGDHSHDLWPAARLRTGSGSDWLPGIWYSGAMKIGTLDGSRSVRPA